jgi:hypothetical protein
MMLVDFEGNVSLAQGAICVELTIGSKTLPTTFFVIKGRGSYNLLLGQDWIYANCCIPSTMHQCIVQWIGDSVEMVKGETSLTVAAAEAQGWTYDRVSCISGKAWDTNISRCPVLDYSRFKQSALMTRFNESIHKR